MPSKISRAFRNLVSILGVMAICCATACSGYSQESRLLFNGQNFDGWVLVNTPQETWRIENEMLICSGKPIGEMRTDRMYQNFEMELEWRHMVPGGNAGIFVWADDVTARGVPFHRGIEVQVLENAYGNTRGYTTHGDIFPIHGATMTPINGRGGSRAFPTEERSKPSPEWNHYRIVCNDGKISLSVNGKEVTRGENASPRKGYICLESEGGVVHYRNIRIKELPDTQVDEKDIAIAARGFRSLYSGLDLRGWEVVDEKKAHWQVKDWVLSHEPNTNDGDQSQSKLQSTAEFAAQGMIVDFRLIDGEKSAVNLTIPGVEAAIALSKSAENALSKQLVEGNGWNRFEASVAGDEMLVSINGKESLRLPYKKQSGKVRIECNGKVELANIYIRN